MTRPRRKHTTRSRIVGLGVCALAAIAITACGADAASKPTPLSPSSTTTPTSVYMVTPNGAGTP